MMLKKILCEKIVQVYVLCDQQASGGKCFFIIESGFPVCEYFASTSNSVSVYQEILHKVFSSGLFEIIKVCVNIEIFLIGANK